jgi:cholesterol oxidase
MPHTTRLSSPIEDIQDHYTVVVVGSGYGGSIAASRLSRAGQQVCLLERGRERQPGEFPQTEHEAVAEMQADTCDGRINPQGLYDMRFYDDINVLVGNGLGGTSLINANVAIRADPRLFEDPRWPSELRDDLPTRIEAGYQRAREMMKPAPVPDRIQLNKLDAQQRSAAAMGAPFHRPELYVAFTEPASGVNHVGVAQAACAQCGDCVTGCNYGAKNTTLMNYLPDAVNHGAEIYTEVEVRRVSRNADGTYTVHYRILDARRELYDAPEDAITADLVILSAGTLGSTEIVLRSRAAGLAASPRVGERFTGNGDVLGFAYNCDQRINGVGWGHRAPKHMLDGAINDGVGPCITSCIDLRGTPDVDAGMLIQEGSLPGPIASLLPVPLAAAADLIGVDTEHGIADKLSEIARECASLVGGPYHGAMQNTQTYLVMGHDGSRGRMELVNDRLEVRWPGLGNEPLFQRVNQRLIEATRTLGGTFVQNPLWTALFKHHLVTVHPLGGCAMADDADRGAVNHKGQLYSGPVGTAVHDGLYVLDGSIIPRSLGCNPSLTISALTERACALIAADRGWTIDYTLPSVPRARRTIDTLGVEFTERMAGHFSTDVRAPATLDDFRRGEAAGRAAGSSFEFILTIVAEDVDRLVSDETYLSSMVGTVRAPALSDQPLTVTDGRFTLLAQDPQDPAGKTMRYRMKLTAAGGKHYWFEGTKYIKDDPGLDVWSDCTTLYITVSEGTAPGGAPLGCGVLHISPSDFLRLLRTARAINGHSVTERLAAVARFGAYFARSLWGIYGGVAAGSTVFDPDAPPRKKRALRAAPPDVHDLATRDGAALRLTRYRGGARGPVVLAHDAGTSSQMFALDTIETNLLECLFERGHDVWLLDDRSSIALPNHLQRCSGDDLAREDFPAAVAHVRAATGASTVQVVAHGFGAATFTMAMLAGLQGVRSAVLSQVATHIATPALDRIKTGLHIPELLDALGIQSLTAYVDSHADWKTRLFDGVLRLYPSAFTDHCSSKICHRIALFYGPLYNHDQLDAATHDALHELFGDAPITVFEHLAQLSRAGRLVAADGSDAYLDHLPRLALPLLLLHGADNACFLPRGTEDSLAALSQANGGGLYQRHVLAGYGHGDCMFGKRAVHDVYPIIVEHLEANS